MSNVFRSAQLTESEGPPAGQDVRSASLKTAAEIVSAHSESVSNSLKPTVSSQSPDKGAMGVRGQRKG